MLKSYTRMKALSVNNSEYFILNLNLSRCFKNIDFFAVNLCNILVLFFAADQID